MRPPGTPVGDASVDAVLSRLENPTTQPFTADYTIVTKATGGTSNATVAVDVDRRSITISNIRFLIEGSRTGTCNTNSGRCTNSIDDGRVSDIQVTHQFYGEAAARRLRTDAARKIGAHGAVGDGDRRPDRHVRVRAGVGGRCRDLLRARQRPARPHGQR